jgi:hypothetical protein
LAVATFLTLIFFGDYIKSASKQEVDKRDEDIKILQDNNSVSKQELDKRDAEIKELKSASKQELDKRDAEIKILQDNNNELKEKLEKRVHGKTTSEERG